MLPFHIASTSMAGILITLGTGFFFGFVLERSGFGNARNLAAQFYLYDMRVLKVMFTAIVTAMLLVFACSALGILDFARVWVPPTYMGAAIVGGFVLGLGFIIGGYCPGTSLVSAATFKIDGLLFATGVAFGMFVFGTMSSALWSFWNNVGRFGRLTLFDWLGVDAGVVVIAVLAMALGAFAFAEFVERMFRREEKAQSQPHQVKTFRRAAIIVSTLIAVLTLAIGQPSAKRKLAWNESALQERLDNREVFIDPAEVLAMMYNRQVDLVLLDVRDQSDFNEFHLVDAQNVDMAKLASAWPKSISREAVVVVMCNDEVQASKAWKTLEAQGETAEGKVNAYVLAGGINRWLDLYAEKTPDVPTSDVASQGDGSFRHAFSEALGQRVAVARPDVKKVPERTFKKKVRSSKPQRAEGGGCG